MARDNYDESKKRKTVSRKTQSSSVSKTDRQNQKSYGTTKPSRQTSISSAQERGRQQTKYYKNLSGSQQSNMRSGSSGYTSTTETRRAQARGRKQTEYYSNQNNNRNTSTPSYSESTGTRRATFSTTASNRQQQAQAATKAAQERGQNRTTYQKLEEDRIRRDEESKARRAKMDAAARAGQAQKLSGGVTKEQQTQMQAGLKAVAAAGEENRKMAQRVKSGTQTAEDLQKGKDRRHAIASDLSDSMTEENRRLMQRQKAGSLTASDKKKIADWEENRAATRIPSNTLRAGEKGVKDSLSGFGQTFTELTDMAASSKNGAQAKAMKMGVQDDKAAVKKIEEEQKRISEESKRLNQKIYQNQKARQADFDKRTKNAGRLEKAWYQGVESGAGMATDTAVGALTGTGQFGSLASMGLRTFGSSTNQAREEGATDKEARIYGALQSAKEVGTELMFQGTGLAAEAYHKVGGKKVGLSLADKAANALTKGLTGKKADIVHGGVKLLGGTMEENLEEVAGWGLDPLIKEYTYGKNVRERTKEQLNQNIPEITNKEQAEAAAAYFATDKFETDLTKDFMSEGMSEKEAKELAALYKEYYTAYYAGDEETVDRIAGILSGAEGLSKASWSKDELMDTLLSTTMLTATTGAPAAISTSVMGNQIFDSQAMKDKFGDKAAQIVANEVMNSSDAKLSIKAEAMKNRLDSGKDLTGTQKFELAQAYEKKVRDSLERKEPWDSVVENELKDKQLVDPIARDENGGFDRRTREDLEYYQAGDETQKKYQENYSSAMQTVESIAKSDKSISETEADRTAQIADAIAAVEDGGLTVGNVHEFAYGNDLARAALKAETGIDLDQYVVTDKDGNVDRAATAVATEEVLFKIAAENYVATAKAETEAFIDHKKGEMDTDIMSRLGAEGQTAWKEINKDLDPRDMQNYLKTANAASYMYAAGRNTETGFNDALKATGNLFSSVNNEALNKAFEAGRQDRVTANTPAVGQTVEAGKAMSETSTESIPEGMLTIDENIQMSIPDSVQEVYKALATSTGVNIHLVASLDIKDEKGNVIGQANGMSEGDTITLNMNAKAESNLGYVFMHEMTHQIKKYAPEAYQNLENLIRDTWFEKDYAGMQRALKHKIDLYAANNQKLSEADAMEEIVADAMAEAIDDPTFVFSVCNEDISTGRAILNSIRSALRSLRQMLANGVSNPQFHNNLLSYLDILKTAEALWVHGLHEATKARANQAINAKQDEMNKRYSQSESNIKQVADMLTGNLNEDIKTIRREAKPVQDELNRLLKVISDDMGLKYKNVKQKKVSSIKDKIGRHGEEYDLLSMKDHARSSLILKDFSFESVSGALERLSYIIGPVNVEKFDRGENRYKGLHVTSTAKNGINFEIQLTTAEHQRIKHEDDAIYEFTRNKKDSDLTESELLAYNAELQRGEELWSQFDPTELLETGNSLSPTESAFQYSSKYIGEEGSSQTPFTNSENLESLSLMILPSSNRLTNVIGESSSLLDEESLSDYNNKSKDNLQKNVKSDKIFSLNAPVERVKDLVAVHNVWPEKLIQSLDMGGLAMPSIAVTKADMGHGKYGSISLLFNSDVIDPEMDSDNRVWGGDAYTPTFPTISRKFSDSKGQEIEKRLLDILGFEDRYEFADSAKGLRLPSLDEDNLGDKLRHGITPREAYANDLTLQMAYLTEQGKAPAIPMMSVKMRNQDENFWNTLADKISEKEVEDYNAGDLSVQERIDRFGPVIGETLRSVHEDSPFYKKHPELLEKYDDLKFADVDNYMRDLRRFYEEGGLPQRVDESQLKEKIDENIDKESYEDWVENLFDGIVEKEGIWNEGDIFDEYGNRKDWEELHEPVTVQNVVAAMKRELAAGQGNFGGVIKGAAQKEYQTLDELREDEDRLQMLDDEEYYRLMEEAEEKVESALEAINEHNPQRSSYDYRSKYDIGSYVAEILNTTRERDDIQSQLLNGYDIEATDEMMDELMVGIDAIAEIPTGYFEAKPARVVDFNEVAAAIVPDVESSVSKEIRERLEAQGVEVIAYKADSEEDRKAKLNEVADRQELKFSITDNEGTALSEGQVSFFDRSQNRDAEGKLKVMLHGTDADFTEFDPSKARPGTLGRAFYFSDSASHAGQYGNVGRYYLNLEHPLTGNTNDITKEQLRRFVAYLAGNEDYGIENYGADATIDSVTDSVWGGTDFEMLRDLNLSAVGDFAEALKVFNRVNGTEYDGIITDVETAAFYPEQIKRTDNLNPTLSKDTRYSITDSNGKALTDAQVHYFRNSQARDMDGRLVPVYHSTSNGGFSIFDPSYSDDNRSIFFTSNREMSKSYIRGYGEDFEATTFGLPTIEWDEIEDLGDVVHYFRKLREAPGNSQDRLGIRIRIPGTENEDGSSAESYASWGEESWSYDDTLDALIEKYGKDYKNVEGEFIDEDGAILGEFNDWHDLANELVDCVKYINDQIGTEGKGETGTYQCYLNLENPMIIDCKGRNWDSILGDGFEELSISYDGDSFYVDGTTIPWTLEEIREEYGEGFADAAEEWIDSVEDPESGGTIYTWDGGAFNPEEEGYWPTEENTRYWCHEAEAMGYDGVIFMNLMDNGPHGYGTEVGDVYVAFNSNQIKDIYNFEPTENPDIRYSIIDEDEANSRAAYEWAEDNSIEALTRYEDMLGKVDAETYYAKPFNEDDVAEFLAALRDDEAAISADPVLEEDRVRMARSKTDFFNNVNAKWNDRWITEGRVLDTKSVKTDIRNLVMGVMANSDTDAKYRNKLVNNTLIDIKNAYQLMKQDRTDVAAALLYHSAQRMIDGVEFYVDDTFDQYKTLKDYFRNTKISLGEEYWSDVDYGAFRKQNLNRMRLVKGRTNVDQVYMELAEMFPEWFDTEETLAVPDMLEQMAHVLDAVQPYKEAYSSEAAAELAFDIADSLYDIMEGGKGYASLADTYKNRFDAKTKAMKQRHAEAMLRMRRQAELGVQAERAKWRAREENRRERTQHKEVFNKIQKNYDWLKERLVTNTVDRHIPEQYKKELAKLLMAFDLQTVGSKERQKRTGRASQGFIKMAQLKATLSQIEQRVSSFQVNDAITDLIDQLASTVEGKSIDELSNNELNQINSLLKALKHEFVTYENVRINNKKMETAAIGKAQVDSALEHAKEFGPGKDFQNAPGWFDKIINLDEMTPAYMFRRIDEDNKGLGLVYREIRRSFDKYVRNQNQLNDWMEEIVGKYHNKGLLWNKYGSGELTNWRSENYAQTFNLTNGTVRLTPAQMMSVFCLANRAQAKNHMTGAGIVVAPVSFNAKMLSDVKKKINRALPVVLTDADIKQITDALTPEQLKVAQDLQELMSTKMAAWGNEASMDVIGIELFKEDNYFPIKSDEAALKSELTNDQFVQAIMNFGFAKAVQPGARNAIMVEDIFDVVTEHCNNMNLYNAYSASIKDFMKVYNYRDFREDGSEYTVKQAVAHAYSSKATTFIMTFLKDLNGNVSGRASGIEDAYNGMLANAKKAAVFANLRVAAQQPTALTRAFAVIDLKYIKGIKIEKGAMEEMFEHCPIALWKSWGYYDINMGKSIEDIMMNNGRWLEDKATDLYGALDNVTWTAIWQMVKNEMKDTHPNVEIGTEEYWELCNERMSEIVDLTQVVDSPMHRSHAMRSKNFLVKTATAFMAEPTLTFNMIRDGWVRAAEARKQGDHAKASKILARTIAVALLQAATVAGAAALVDAMRRKRPDKDDEDERFLHLWWVNALENFKDELKVWNKVYFVKDIASIFEGWDNANLALQGIQKFALGWRQLSGDKYARSSASWWENMADGLGYMTGVPIKTMRTGLENAMNMLGLTSPLIEGVKDRLDDISFADDDKEEGAAGASNILGIEIKGDGILGKLISKADKDEESGKGSEDSEEKTMTREQQRDKLRKLDAKAAALASEKSGAELDEAMWDSISEGYTKEIEKGNLDYIEQLRNIYRNNGGDMEAFDAKVKSAMASAYKKTFKDNMTQEDIDNQFKMRQYMESYLGFSEAEISEMVYKSDAAKDLKVAFRINDEAAINETGQMLARAGLSEADWNKLYKNRNRMKLESYNGKYKDRLKSTGTFNWPVDGTITSVFGNRNSPGGIGSTNHQAIDIAAPTGTPVGAADGGTVIYVGRNGGYGNSVGIKHDDGRVTYYNHLSGYCVNEGDTVAQGQEVGQVGSTGNSTGPHLDFKVLDADGNPVDPMQFLDDAGKAYDLSA